MGRGYDREYLIERAGTARRLVAGIALSTDVIVGFPGETERDFEMTLDLLRAVEFDSAYMFMYSPREGTAAFQIADDVEPAVKKRRFAELAKLQGEITASCAGKDCGLQRRSTDRTFRRERGAGDGTNARPPRGGAFRRRRATGNAPESDHSRLRRALPEGPGR